MTEQNPQHLQQLLQFMGTVNSQIQNDITKNIVAPSKNLDNKQDAKLKDRFVETVKVAREAAAQAQQPPHYSVVQPSPPTGDVLGQITPLGQYPSVPNTPFVPQPIPPQQYYPPVSPQPPVQTGNSILEVDAINRLTIEIKKLNKLLKTIVDQLQEDNGTSVDS